MRNATVSPNAVIIYPNPTPSIKDEGEKRVAVYARVSTKSTEQVSSIENQTRYYTEKVEKTPNWDLQEIYSDEGKSGTSMKTRTQFKQMLKNAADNKMDLIPLRQRISVCSKHGACTEQLRFFERRTRLTPWGSTSKPKTYTLSTLPAISRYPFTLCLRIGSRRRKAAV